MSVKNHESYKLLFILGTYGCPLFSSKCLFNLKTLKMIHPLCWLLMKHKHFGNPILV